MSSLSSEPDYFVSSTCYGSFANIGHLFWLKKHRFDAKLLNLKRFVLELLVVGTDAAQVKQNCLALDKKKPVLDMCWRAST